jgi:uncharacterized RDD family membrane protein YckC
VDSLGRPMAAWWRRLLAIVIDGVLLFVPLVIALAVTPNATTTSGSLGSTNVHLSSSAWAVFGIGFIVTLGYFAFLDGSRRGQTVGKLALGIAVRDFDNGGPIGAGRALGRRIFFFVGYFLFVIPFLVNALWPLWDPRRQALHDKLARSCVVQIR